MDTPTGVRKISENVLAEKRAIITTDSSTESFNNAPDGTILIDTDTGNLSLKLEGQSDWVPSGIKQDNTICILKDSAILSETFTVTSVSASTNTFSYRTKDNVPVTDGKIDAQGHFIFTLRNGTYIPGRNHLSATLDGVLKRTTADSSLTELDNTRFYIEDSLSIGQTVTAVYINWMRIGNPYPRIYINKETPTDAEIGDLWIDLNGEIDNGTYGDDDFAHERHISWANIDGKPTTVAGYNISDAAQKVHTHTVADITDWTTTTLTVPKAKQADNATTLQGLVPGTIQPNALLQLNSLGQIDPSIIPASYGMKKGMVMMWYGSSTNVPSGWHICDGSNGTPDLQNRFVVGAGSSYGLGASGGETTHTLSVNEMPNHGHNTYVPLPSIIGDHYHTIGYNNNNGGYFLQTGRGNHDNVDNPTSLPGGVSAHSWNGSGDGGGGCDRTGENMYTSNARANSGNNINYPVNVENTGGNAAHNNMPPYTALFYIMKL